MTNVSPARVPVTRRQILAVALGASATLLVSCAPAASPAPAVVPKEREKVMFRLDWLPSGRHAPFFVALDKGWYAELGMDVEIGDAKGSGQSAQMVGTGNATFGHVEGGAIVKAVSTEIPIKSVFLGLAKSPLGYTYRKDTNIKTPKDLEGKTYGAVPFAATFQLWPAFAAANGIDTSKVTVVNTDPDSNVQLVAARKADFLDGAIGYEDYLLGEAGAPSDILLMTQYGLDYVGHAVVASTSTIQQKPDLVRRFVEGTMRGFDFVKANQNESLEIFLKRNPELKAGFALSVMKAASPLMSNPSGAQTEQQWQSTIDLLAKTGQLKKTPKPSDVYTNDFLPKR